MQHMWKMLILPLALACMAFTPALAQQSLNADSLMRGVMQEFPQSQNVDQRKLRQQFASSEEGISSFNRCFSKLDRAKLATLQRKQKIVNRRIKALCDAGKTDEAQKFKLENNHLANNPAAQELKACIDQLGTSLGIGAISSIIDGLPACQQAEMIPQGALN